MTTPSDPFDRLDQAPTFERGDLVRFARIDLQVDKVAFEPGLQDPTAKRKVRYDPAVHTPDQGIDALTLVVTPVNPRHQIITRQMLAPGVEFDVFRDSVRRLGLPLRDLDGTYAQVRWTADRRLGKYTARDGTERDRTAPVVECIFPTAEECQAAADAFFAGRRGGGSSEGAAAAAPVPVAAGPDGWTDAQRAERAALLPFLPAIARGKNRAQFLEALAADVRLGRLFRPTDPEVTAIADTLVDAPAPEG
jgi:hypothetical protein